MISEAKYAINAFAAYMAKEAGAFGIPDMKDEVVGVIGGIITDTQETAANFLSGDISVEEVSNKVGEILDVGIKTIAIIAVEAAAKAIQTYVPVLGPVVIVAKEYVKKEIIPLVVDTGKKIIKSGIKKILSIFR